MKRQKRAIQSLNALSKTSGLTMLAHMGENHTTFQMLIATILSARAKDEVTLPVANQLFEHYPDAETLACANANDVKKIIRQIGFYNNKAKMIIASAQMITRKFQGKIPETLEQLLLLPGVGRKVANCILVYAFGHCAIPVDTHVHRISNRLGWVKTRKPEETEKKLEQLFPKRYWPMINETLVKYGKSICAPTSPICSACRVRVQCPRIGVTRSR